MQIYKIPEYFNPSTLDSVNIHFYQTTTSTSKNKIALSQSLLCILVEGQKEIISHTGNQKFCEDKLCLMASGNVLMTETLAKNSSYESILLFFTNRDLLNLVEKYNLKLPQQLDVTNRGIVISKDEYLYNFQASLKLLESSLIHSQNLRIAKFEEIFLYLWENYPSEICTFIARIISPKHILTLKEVVKNHLFDNLTYAELAFLCNMSVSTFKRKFQDIYHLTPKKYFIKQRMKRADYLLKNNRKPSSIYEELGYETHSSFSHEFKKYFGLSPSDYVSQV